MSEKKPSTKKKRRYFKWLTALLSLAVVGVVALSYQPQWIAPLLEQALKKQGIEAKLSGWQGHWQLPNYHLQGQMTASRDGVRVDRADLETAINLQAWWRGEAFIEQLTLTDVQADIDVDRLRASLPKSHRTTKATDSEPWRHYLPIAWSLSCSHCDIRAQQQAFSGSLTARGQGDRELRVFADDARIGALSLQYDAHKQHIRAQSPRLDLEAFSGYPAVLSEVDVDIPLSARWQSRLQTQVAYQGLNSSVTLQGDGENRLRLETLTADKTLSLTAERHIDAQGERINLSSDDIDVSLINTLKPVALPLLSRHLSPALTKQLQALTIEGRISGQVALQRHAHETAYRLLQVETTLDHFSISDGQRGFSRLSGDLVYADNQLDFQLDLNDSVVALPTLFSETLPPLNGQIQGDFDVDQRLLSLDNISLKNKDFSALSASGTLQLGETLPIDLTASADNLHVARLPLYLSQKFPPQTHEWLSKALLSGKKNHATARLKGDLKRFLKDDNFVFQIDVEARDGKFRYLKNNPDIAIKHASVHIDRHHLSVQADKADLITTIKGKTRRVPVTGSAEIADMRRAVVVVNAQTEAQPLSLLSRFAERSIAKNSVQTVKKIAEVDGDFALALDLQLDVHHNPMRTNFEVNLNSDNASATLKRYPKLPLKKAKTTVLVNQDGLQHLSLDGRMLARPVSIELTPVPSSQKPTRQSSRKPSRKSTGGYDIAIQAKKANILQWLPRLDLLSVQQAALIDDYGVLRGISDYEVALRLDGNGDLRDVKIHSLLQSTALNVFALVVKGKQTRLPLDITYKPAKRRLYVDLDKRFYLTVGMDKAGGLDGLLLDNLSTDRRYQSGQAQVIWDAKSLDAMGLKSFYDDWKKTLSESTAPPLNAVLDITVDAVKLDKNTVEPMRLQGDFDRLHIASPLIAGTLSYRNNYLQANIDRLEVDSLFHLIKKQGINPEGREVTRVDFSRALPAMDVEVNQLIFKGNNIGKGTIHTSMQQGFYSIDQILISGDKYYFDASGYEIAEPQGIATHLRADFKGEDLRRVIRQFRLNEMLDAKFLDLSLDLSWPGKAHTVNLRQSYGSADLNAQSVQMLNVSSGVGSVFGMMDVVGILKRVSMDFQNLNSSKLSFDTIKGHWNIGGGRAMTRNAYATGSVVELKLVGGADLHRREFDDMDLTVIPKASNVIPIIGAVAGGVVGGAAGLLVQQALGDNINQVVGLPYVISGTWQTPVVSFGDEEEDG